MKIAEEYKSISQRLKFEHKNHLGELQNCEDVSLAIKPNFELEIANLTSMLMTYKSEQYLAKIERLSVNTGKLKIGALQFTLFLAEHYNVLSITASCIVVLLSLWII